MILGEIRRGNHPEIGARLEGDADYFRGGRGKNALVVRMYSAYAGRRLTIDRSSITTPDTKRRNRS